MEVCEIMKTNGGKADIGIDEEFTKQVTTERETSTGMKAKALQIHVAKQPVKKLTNVTLSTDISIEEFTNPNMTKRRHVY